MTDLTFAEDVYTQSIGKNSVWKEMHLCVCVRGMWMWRNDI